MKPAPSNPAGASAAPALPARSRGWQALEQIAAREGNTLHGHSAFLLAEIERVDTLVAAAGETLAVSLRTLDELAREQNALAMKIQDTLQHKSPEENTGQVDVLVSQLERNASGLGDHVDQIVRSIQFEDLSRQTLQHCRQDLESLQSEAAAWQGLHSALGSGADAETALVAFNEKHSELDDSNSRIRQVTSANLAAGEIELFQELP